MFRGLLGLPTAAEELGSSGSPGPWRKAEAPGP